MVAHLLWGQAVGGSNPPSPTKICRSLERVTGIEPAFLAWKARALPLSYTRTYPAAANGRDATVAVRTAYVALLDLPEDLGPALLSEGTGNGEVLVSSVVELQNEWISFATVDAGVILEILDQ